MTIALLLKNGTGSLFPNTDSSKGQPALVGFAEFAQDETKDGRKVRLEVGAWEKESNGNKYYSLSIGGIPASLFKETRSSADKAPDYSGTFGFNKELRIAGWKRMSTSKQQYISLAITEKSESTSAGSSAGKKESASVSAAKPASSEANAFDFV